jgi:hypothetical protein
MGCGWGIFCGGNFKIKSTLKKLILEFFLGHFQNKREDRNHQICALGSTK